MPITKNQAGGLGYKDIKTKRRAFLTRWLQGIGLLISLALVYPLLRFLGYAVKPRPRYRSVAAPLPLSGYHAEKDFILFAGRHKPFAVSRTCTHLGCRVSYLEDKRIIECPCHQSRFSPEGRVLNGPAKRNLKPLAVAVKKNNDGTIKEYVVTL